MDRGRVLQIGTPDEVMDRPADETVASFVGANTVLAGVVREKRGGRLLVSVNGEEIESAGDFTVGEWVGLYIRPEKVRVGPIPGPGGGGRGHGTGTTGATVAGNLFPATVMRIVPMGFYEKVHLDCGFPLTAYVTRQLSEEMGVREGQGILASFEPESVHVIARSGK
jgi:tungstate transport system ATP-binding protein